jgi:hypothetical protein
VTRRAIHGPIAMSRQDLITWPAKMRESALSYNVYGLNRRNRSEIYWTHLSRCDPCRLVSPRQATADHTSRKALSRSATDKTDRYFL